MKTLILRIYTFEKGFLVFYRNKIQGVSVPARTPIQNT